MDGEDGTAPPAAAAAVFVDVAKPPEKKGGIQLSELRDNEFGPTMNRSDVGPIRALPEAKFLILARPCRPGA